MERLSRIKRAIKDKKRLLVMFSGGLDSTLLARLAYDALGEDAVGVTIDSPIVQRADIKDAKQLAEKIGIGQEIIDINELGNKEFVNNPPDRCYICRKIRDKTVTSWAKGNGFDVIADGMNYSDFDDYRPGLKASDEDGIWHPFIEFKVTKEDIRKYSSALDLPAWDKPATVCLCSRFPYGFGLNKGLIRRVERAEAFLKELGFKWVRVRCFPYDTALVEVEDLKGAIRKKDEILSELRGIGFLFVSLDLEGFESGKMNRLVQTKR
ncbi:MAG: ATP-dependent sacrificial sulfur transferase LarE [Thermodesulfobacteriota bacterium]|nr:ATP-dependent sacrificial sulfur transferase LarE [Thermodesulfobacteriota bacterium]